MSKAKAPRVFVPLTKVDEEQRLVYGRITQEELDKTGEVMDYESSKPNFEKWSNDIHEASGGLSKGNVRVMHGLSVAGKLTEIQFNDDEKAIDVCAKIVDDGEWNKITEGCYTGFSVGGKYEKRWQDQGIKKFTALPNEVSIVDNPCVGSACFTMFKADGAEEQVMFKSVEGTGDEPAETLSEETPTEETPATETPPADDTANKAAPSGINQEPSATAVAEKAGELAKAANDGSDWQSHIEAARELLLKGDSALSMALEQEKEAGNATTETTEEENAAGEGDADASTDENAAEGGDVEKVTPPGVKQKWEASDGQTFEKKADAEAHEATLAKADTPKSEVEQLRDRMAKALSDEPDEDAGEVELLEDYDRLGKAVQVFEEIHETGFQPDTLKKGMYTVSRFANLLWDLGSLTRKIAAEGKREGDDEADKTVSNEMKEAMTALSGSFKTYVDNQITELLAGIDDDVIVEVYDYYYAAANENGEDRLAKDVCSLIDARREPSRERRDVLAKGFGFVEGVLEATDELSPPMQKRFDKLTADNEELKKLAEDAVGQVEDLSKRLKAIEDTPAPRAPRNIALLDGDGKFLGKSVTTEEEKVQVLEGMLKAHGADGLALELIKAAQAKPIRMIPNGG